MRTFRGCLVVGAFAVVAALTVYSAPGSAGAATGTWTGIELRPLNPGESAFVEDINNAGVSAGNSGVTPVKWDAQGNPTALPVPNGCTQSNVGFINDQGDIAGFSQCGATPYVATIWHSDGTVTTGASMFVSAFNNSDTVAGETALPEGHVVLQTPGSAPQSLIEGGARSSHVEGLTNTYLAVGNVRYTDPTTGQARDAAAGWYGPYVFPFLNDTTDNTYAGPANDAGYTIVDIIPTGAGNPYSVIVAPGGQVLPLGTGQQDAAYDINNAGVVVGTHPPTTANSNTTPMLYAYGASVALSDLLSPSAPPLILQVPAAINDNSWIVGHGATSVGSTTQVTSWLMRPPS